MVLTIPTMLAQDKLYLGLCWNASGTATSSSRNAVAAADDQSISYNSASGAYEGIINMKSGSTNFCFSFYTGTPGNATTWYGSSNMMASSVALVVGTPVSKALNERAAGIAGYYMTFPTGASYTEAPVKIVANLSTKQVTFELQEVKEEAPENYYVWQDGGDGMNGWGQMLNLKPVEGQEGIFTGTGEFSIPAYKSNISIYFGTSATTNTQGILLANNQAVELNASLPVQGASQTVNLTAASSVFGNTKYIVLPEKGTYTFTLDWNTKTVTISQAPAADKLYYAFATGASAAFTPDPATDGYLSYNAEKDVWEGDIISTSTPYQYVRFYVTGADNAITYISPTNKNTEMKYNYTVGFATSNVVTWNGATTYIIKATKTQSDAGGYYITGWAANPDARYQKEGKANLSLNFNASTTSGFEFVFTKVDAWMPTPTQIYILRGTGMNQGTSAPTGYTLLPVENEDEQLVFEGTVDVPAGGMSFVLANQSGVTSGVNFIPVINSSTPVVEKPNTNPVQKYVDMNQRLTSVPNNFTFNCTLQESVDAYTNYNYLYTAQQGKTKITYNYDTKALTVEYLEDFVTFNFTGGEDAYKYVKMVQVNGDDMNDVTLTSNTYSYNYTSADNAQFALAPEEGYLMSVSCATPGALPEAYQIMSTGQGSTMVGVEKAGRGYQFNVSVIELASLPKSLSLNYINTAGSMGIMYLPVPGNANVTTAGELTQSETDPTVYTGKFNIPVQKNFAFSSGSAATGDLKVYAATYSVPISFSSYQGVYEWPSLEDPEQVDNAKFSERSTGFYSWYISALPGTMPQDAEVTFTVNFSSGTISLQIGEEVGQVTAPENLYLWGTTGGYTDGAKWEVMGTFEKADNADVYTLTMDVPECTGFEPDGEFTPSDGDPSDRGFYFFLCDNNVRFTTGPSDPDEPTSPVVKPVVFQAELENHLIDLTEDGAVFTTTVSYDKTGHNFVCITPGVVKMQFDFDLMQFTAEMEEVEETFTLNFTGVEDAAEIASIVTITVDGEADNNVLNVTENPFNVTYVGSMTLTFTPAEGCTVSVSNSVENEAAPYTITEDGGVVTLTVEAGCDGYEFTVALTKKSDGVNSLVGEEGEVEVYNLQGVRVRGENLPAGIYIVNGKKVVIR